MGCVGWVYSLTLVLPNRYDEYNLYGFVSDYGGLITVLKLEPENVKFVTTLRGHTSKTFLTFLILFLPILPPLSLYPPSLSLSFPLTLSLSLSIPPRFLSPSLLALSPSPPLSVVLPSHSFTFLLQVLACDEDGRSRLTRISLCALMQVPYGHSAMTWRGECFSLAVLTRSSWSGTLERSRELPMSLSGTGNGKSDRKR